MMLMQPSYELRWFNGRLQQHWTEVDGPFQEWRDVPDFETVPDTEQEKADAAAWNSRLREAETKRADETMWRAQALTLLVDAHRVLAAPTFQTLEANDALAERIGEYLRAQGVSW
jgi:hypothetical protein